MKIKIVCLALLLSLLTACNQDVQTNHAQITALSSDDSAHFVGKPHAPVSMSYEFATTAALNQQLEIKLVFRVERDTEMLEVKYRPQNGLALTESVQPNIFSNMPKGALQTVTVRLIPEQAGLFYLNVFASIDVNNVMQSRSFAVPVEVVADAELQSKTGAQDSQLQNGLGKGMKYLPEQNVISMPARESTSD